MENPFTLTFGKEPRLNLSRISQIGQILDTFCQDEPSQQVYMITGVRGSGKTVALTTVTKYFLNRDDWIVIECNPSSRLLENLAAKLYSHPKLRQIFSSLKLNFTFLGFGAAGTVGPPVIDTETAIEEMLKKLLKAGKRLLIVIDEVMTSPSMREFAHSFQILIRRDYPLFLVMTGLYENVYTLQNEKNLTFLYRAPKIELEFLSLSAVASTYRKYFDLTEEEAARMAKITKGYPFAFQALGYLRWENKDRQLDDLIPEYDQYLEDFVYEKVWMELPEKEKQILLTIAAQNTKIKDIREKLGISSGELSVYRKRLSRRGLVDISTYGYMFLSLPRFGEIIRLLAFES